MIDVKGFTIEPRKLQELLKVQKRNGYANKDSHNPKSSYQTQRYEKYVLRIVFITPKSQRHDIINK